MGISRWRAALKASGIITRIFHLHQGGEGFVVAISCRDAAAEVTCAFSASISLSRCALLMWILGRKSFYPCCGGGVLDTGSRLSSPPGFQVYSRRMPLRTDWGH